MLESKVAQGASRRTNVEGIARSHQNYAQTIEFIPRRQQCSPVCFEKYLTGIVIPNCSKSRRGEDVSSNLLTRNHSDQLHRLY
jgi:hypothetical protein